jgi:hypothetical protein
VRLAARGARNLDRGEEPVTNPEEVRLLRAQARRIYVESALGAALLTGLSLLARLTVGG